VHKQPQRVRVDLRQPPSPLQGVLEQDDQVVSLQPRWTTSVTFTPRALGKRGLGGVEEQKNKLTSKTQ